MKITIDKIEAHPPHAFSADELRAFLRMVPRELLRDVSTVRLSNAQKYSGFRDVASFSRFSRRLVIASRGISRDDSMRQVIRCLVRENFLRASDNGFGHRPILEGEIEAFIAQLFTAISQQMPAPPYWNRVELRYVRKRRTLEV